MSKFTTQEIKEEHRRRRGQENVHSGRSVPQHNDVCIHCGHPLEHPLPAGQVAGLCESCESQGD